MSLGYSFIRNRKMYLSNTIINITTIRSKSRNLNNTIRCMNSVYRSVNMFRSKSRIKRIYELIRVE